MPDERDVLELDAVIVGAGPAGLAAALHLQRLVERHNAAVAAGAPGRKLDDVTFAVLEKGAEVGNHILSGAVMDPIALRELLPDFETDGCPGIACTKEDVYFLTKRGKLRIPFTPSWIHNEGNRIVSLNRLVKWLAKKVEQAGVEIFPSFPAASLLIEEGRVAGVRIGDKGIDKHGNRKGNFEPGIDVRAKVTILAEGPRGSLTKDLVQEFKLDEGQNPQVYATGVKELWKVPGCDAKHKGRVIHTLGWPLDRKTFGGSFIYFMGEDLVSVGFCTGLDYHHPATDPHRVFQEFKQHPYVRELLAGGEMVRYGAKSIPEGGWWSRPRPYVDGALIVGDSGSNLNPARLKGIHTALKTGMLAAETAFEALLEQDASARVLERYERRVEGSFVKRELYGVRNFHQAFERGMPWAMLDLGLQMITGGRGLRDRYPAKAGHEQMRKLAESGPKPPPMPFDGKLTFDKLTDVFHSGTVHEEDQPSHLVVTVPPDHCSTTCAQEYGNPCQHFCPAAVYEMVDKDPGDTDVRGPQRLRINFTNCVHCKTCDIMDPYQVIEWKTPEGGGGPVYTDL